MAATKIKSCDDCGRHYMNGKRCDIPDGRRCSDGMMWIPIEDPMLSDDIVMARGSDMVYLGYTIMNCKNDDGLILMKDGCNIGSYGKATYRNVIMAMKDALLYYMIAKPELSRTLVSKLGGHGGTYHEYYLLEAAIRQDFPSTGVPSSITPSIDSNRMIEFCGLPLMTKL